MARCPDLPFLPGYTFNPNIGKTNFPVKQLFEYIGKGNRALVEKVKPNMFGTWSDKYPSFYPRGEVPELPGWIAYDKHILRFDAFFQETLQEMPGTPYQIRKVNIFFFLEDGTIQVIEPKTENSGVSQGTLISRQRIRFPPPMDDNFYDIVDFNIGREIEFYGRIFKIVDCDAFTRNFLNRAGICVPDPIKSPKDPFQEIRTRLKEGLKPKKPNVKTDKLGKFLANDKKVLHFKAYWDDQKTEYGYLHHLEVSYYLADDTIEICEVQATSGGEPGFLFLKRTKLPKHFEDLPQPGDSLDYTILNVLGNSLTNRRYIVDPLNCGKQTMQFYTEKDLNIGGVINCYGREIILIDCDSFTKEYYAKKYGISDFSPIPMPKDYHAAITTTPKERELPPWNGFGTHEDSAQNCKTVELKPVSKDFKKFLQYDRQGLDSLVLRFRAKMISKIPENCSRNFIISFQLSDDTIGVFEVAGENSGFKPAVFFRNEQIKLPGQKVFTSKPPLIYTAQHMFVGATLLINGYHFVLIAADEYALRYMELHPNQFPKANIKVIMEKVREKLRPIYKDFVAENIPNESSAIPYETLKAKLCRIMGDDFTEHEMITISRAFTANCTKEKFDRNCIRAILLTELKRQLWDEIDRLREYFLLRDGDRTGKLPQKDCYSVLRGCRIPIDKQLLEKIFEMTHCPMTDIAPINIKHDLWWASEREDVAGILIDWCGFNKYLDLEKTFADALK